MRAKSWVWFVAVGVGACALRTAPTTASDGAGPSKGWVALFNGKNLDGWVPKIKGYPAGENFGNTFRVENGVLKVSYDQYPKFEERFGHLFSTKSYKNYRLRIEYRFVGDQCPGGPSWALRNSGVMVHGQTVESMRRDQSFPVSIEVQFLGGAATGERPTGNLCTPGTHVVMDGKLVTQHCINAQAPTIRGDEWVTAEVEVHGNGKIKHIINGQTVLEYEKPQLDEKDPDAKHLLESGAPKLVSEGTISLQAESHPIEFRKVEILELDD